MKSGLGSSFVSRVALWAVNWNVTCSRKRLLMCVTHPKTGVYLMICKFQFLPHRKKGPRWYSVYGAVLQIGRLLVRSQLVSLEFFIDIKSFRWHYDPGVDSASNRNEYQEHPRSKRGRCIRLTTLPLPCTVVMKSGNLNFLEPSGPLPACNGIVLPLPSTSQKTVSPF